MTTEAKPVVTMDPPPAVPDKAPATPETVEVKVGDKTFKVSKEASEAITAMQAASTAKESEYAKQIKALNDKVAAGGTPPAPKSQPKDGGLDTDKMFTDPSGFVADLTNKIKGEVTSTLTKAYNAATAERDFWDAFYGANPDLKANDFYVQAVLSREQEALGPLKVSEAVVKLAEIVKADLLKLAGKAPAAGGGGGKPATEPGTERTPGRSQGGSEHSLTSDAPAPNSLTALLKQRREARRTGGKAAR